MLLILRFLRFSGEEFEGKSQCHGWVEGETPEDPQPRIGPLTEPSEAMALKAPMEGWFTVCKAEIQRLVIGEGRNRQWDRQTEHQLLVYWVVEIRRTFDGQPIECWGEYCVDIAFYGGP